MSIKDFHAQLNADEKASDMFNAMDQLTTSNVAADDPGMANGGWSPWT